MLSSFTHPHVVPNPNDFLPWNSGEHSSFKCQTTIKVSQR